MLDLEIRTPIADLQFRVITVHLEIVANFPDAGQLATHRCHSSPRNYHARKKISESQHPNTHAMYYAGRGIVANSPDVSRVGIQPLYRQISPGNYYTRKTSDSQHPNTRGMWYQPGEATQNIPPPSSQQPPATTALAAGTSSRLDITIKHAGWWTRFLLWISCVSIQDTDSQR
ncbi:hypothetical protein F4604DRAFT_1821950 [Suillus subluteus]|nr:hypothetical protein F4604DRAFT_1821950 [Suillus subluteus]